MIRAVIVVAAAIGIAALGGCGKKAGEKKPVVERELVPQTLSLGKLQITVSLPKDLPGGAKDASSLAWNEDLLDVSIKTGTPVAMQNEINDAASQSLNVTRSDQLADGWWVTASAADGKQTRNRRMIKATDTQAVTCTALVTWKDAKRVEWAESICNSLAVKAQ
jgi:hypothetical protein